MTAAYFLSLLGKIFVQKELNACPKWVHWMKQIKAPATNWSFTICKYLSVYQTSKKYPINSLNMSTCNRNALRKIVFMCVPAHIPIHVNTNSQTMMLETVSLFSTFQYLFLFQLRMFWYSISLSLLIKLQVPLSLSIICYCNIFLSPFLSLRATFSVLH